MLKAFNELIERYEFRYEAQYPELAKLHVLDNSILQWKAENNDAVPTATQKMAIEGAIISKDKIRKLLGFSASLRLQQDWKAAEPTEADRNCSWAHFLAKMRA